MHFIHEKKFLDWYLCSKFDFSFIFCLKIIITTSIMFVDKQPAANAKFKLRKKRKNRQIESIVKFFKSLKILLNLCFMKRFIIRTMSKEAKSSKRKAPKDEKPVKKSKVGKSESDGLKKVRRIFCIYL